MNPSGLMPSAFAFSSDINKTADAPSVSGEALPAVMDPYLRSKTGRNFESASKVVSARMRLSASTTLSNFGGFAHRQSSERLGDRRRVGREIARTDSRERAEFSDGAFLFARAH